MDGICHQFFTGTAFTQYDDRGHTFRGFSDHIKDRLHFRGFAHHAEKISVPVTLSGKKMDLFIQPGKLGNIG